jgi:integrase
VQKHLSTIHANKITFDLVRFRNYLGEYRKNTIIDVNRAIDRITNDPIRDPSNKSRRYKQNTLRDFVSILRGFYLWLIDNNCSQCPREKILKIGIPRGDTMTKTEEQLLTNDEVLAFIKACKTSKDRAFFATLYEGAFRIQELCTLTWGQVSIEDKMIVVNVNGKTGRIGSPYYTYSRCIGSLFC